MRRWLDPLDWLSEHWNAVKTFVEHAVGFSHDALHVVIGVILQIAFAFALRRTLASPLPWLLVFLLEAANEWSDLSIEQWPDLALQFGESAKDLTLTMFLPTVLLYLVKRYPRIFSPARGAPKAEITEGL